MIHSAFNSNLVLVCLAAFLVIGSQVNSDQVSTGSSYMEQVKQLLNTGMEANEQAKSYSNLIPNQDPRTLQMLRDSINKATDLINNYRQNGLSNMPSLPNLPGLNSIMKVPDKLLRAELSMLQDEIRMAQEMMQNPITATMNAPRDLASMIGRMAEQLEQ